MSSVPLSLANKIGVYLSVADAAAKAGYKAAACSLYVAAGKLVPAGLCVKAWSASSVEFFVPEVQKC